MILRLVIGAIIIYLLFKLFRILGPKPLEKGTADARGSIAGEELVEDPVCHTYVPIGDACQTRIDGKRVYFCSQKCLEQYINETKR
jgi:YHS domain-containing protein